MNFVFVQCTHMYGNAFIALVHTRIDLFLLIILWTLLLKWIGKTRIDLSAHIHTHTHTECTKHILGDSNKLFERWTWGGTNCCPMNYSTDQRFIFKISIFFQLNPNIWHMWNRYMFREKNRIWFFSSKEWSVISKANSIVLIAPWWELPKW